jgi:hypothetical protein
MTAEIAAIIRPTTVRLCCRRQSASCSEQDVELEAIVVDDGPPDGTSEVGVWLDSTSHGRRPCPSRSPEPARTTQMAGTSSS